jgi:hypothetical protein
MLVQDDAFPIVWMHYDRSAPADAETAFETLERLLSREQPIVLLGRGAGDKQDQSHEERKQVSLWMKRNRDALHRLVKAMVYVEPQTAKRFIAKAGALTFQKFWGYPMLVTSDEAKAYAMASRLLAGESAASVKASDNASAE